MAKKNGIDIVVLEVLSFVAENECINIRQRKAFDLADRQDRYRIIFMEK